MEIHRVTARSRNHWSHKEKGKLNGKFNDLLEAECGLPWEWKTARVTVLGNSYNFMCFICKTFHVVIVKSQRQISWCLSTGRGERTFIKYLHRGLYNKGLLSRIKKKMQIITKAFEVIVWRRKQESDSDMTQMLKSTERI